MEFRDLTPAETESVEDTLEYRTLDAPHNTIYDAKNNRVLALPQTLNASETEFVIRRDVDNIKEFFAQEPVDPISAFGKGGKSGFAALPQVGGSLIKEQAELADTDRIDPAEGLYNLPKLIRLGVVAYFGKDEVIEKGQGIIDRNKKYMADAGLERPAEGGVSGLMYDIGNGGSSLLTSIGLTVMTRSPKSATVLFGAIQKSQVYEEARAAGKTPREASNISNVAGVVEGSLEMVGLDKLMVAMKGNSAVKRFVSGFIIEATQEGSQQAGEELITQGTDIRNKSTLDTINDILYNAALGGIIGGSSNATIGAIVKQEAIDQGIDEQTAEKMAVYAETNLDLAKQDITEFIDKELAPIAADEKSAMEFMQIMKKFGNDVSVAEREQLSPEERAVFDQYVDMFNKSYTDKTGVASVEKTFFDQAKSAGVTEDEATAASKIIGARADAASRALGITPEQWLRSQNLQLKRGENQKKPVDIFDPTTFEDTTSKPINPADAELYRALDILRSGETLQEPEISKKKQPNKYPLLGLIRKRGGIKIGSTAHQNLTNRGITQRTMPGIFRKDSGISELDDIDAFAVQDALGDGVAIPEDNYNAREDWLYEKIADEAFNQGKTNTKSIDRQYIDELDRTLGENNIDVKSLSNEEIKGLLEAIYSPQAMESIDDEILYQNARGSINFANNKAVITLFKDANFSTLVHELGHLFLRDMQAVSKVSIRPMVKKDFETVKNWLGAEGDNFTVDQEEKFARGFEAYLREGKAPKPELQSVFDRFKEWLTAIYKNVRDLNVEINDDIRRVFDRMLGGDFVRSEELLQKAEARDVAADYEKVANAGEANTFLEDTGAVFHNANVLGADMFVPVSTRLGNIDQKLKHAVRQFLFKTGLYTHEDRVAIKPFVKSISDNMTEKDYRRFDLALKNRDKQKVDFLIDKYKLKKEYAAVRDVLDTIYNQAKDVGIDLNYIEEYFPRKVKNNMVGEYLAAMRNLPEWGQIQLALNEADPNSDFTQEERAEFVNTFLRGFTSRAINLSKPSFSKERTIDYVTPEFNKYYQDSMQTLMEYVGGMRHGIESRKMFGKSETETAKNIGEYVLGLVNQGVIKASQEEELRKILKSVVEPSGTHGFVGWAKNASYIYLMGNPISAITQIQDLAFSLWKNGYFSTAKGFVKSLARQQVLKKEDIGIDNILQEFEESSRASNAVRKVFKAVGLETMDNIGKETYIDASYSRLRKLNRKNNKAFNKQLNVIFGKEAAQVKKDLTDGTISESVKYLLFSELSDVQPISLAEMPVNYLRGGNARVFYMLKSYTVKQIDIYRREIYSEIRSGESARIANGLSNLVRLAVALMLMGMASDALKDLILGREIEMDDLVTDNILKTMTFTKYQIYKVREEGIAAATMRTLFFPPIAAPLDDATKDVVQIGFGDKEAKDSELLGKIPVVGKFYYWWWGGGRAKEEKQN